MFNFTKGKCNCLSVHIHFITEVCSTHSIFNRSKTKVLIHGIIIYTFMSIKMYKPVKLLKSFSKRKLQDNVISSQCRCIVSLYRIL